MARRHRLVCPLLLLDDIHLCCCVGHRPHVHVLLPVRALGNSASCVDARLNPSPGQANCGWQWCQRRDGTRWKSQEMTPPSPSSSRQVNAAENPCSNTDADVTDELVGHTRYMKQSPSERHHLSSNQCSGLHVAVVSNPLQAQTLRGCTAACECPVGCCHDVGHTATSQLALPD